jgi:hypothetical protein
MKRGYREKIFRVDEGRADALARRMAIANRERRKDSLLLITTLAVIGMAVLASSLSLLLVPESSAWAAPLLTSIVAGLFGYHAGKARRPTRGA